jgi:hypothetical protein
MRRLLLTVVLVGLVVAPGIAQRRPGGGGRGGMRGGPMSPDALLFNKSVQDELKLSDKQKEQLGELRKKQFSAMREVFKETDREKAAELMKKNQERMQKSMAKFKDGMTTAQARRFRQIQVQIGGLAVLNSPRIQKELDLTDKQKEQVKETLADLRKDREDLLKGAGRDREKRMAAGKKIQKLNQDALDKLVKSFTPEQQKTYKELRGEPFAYKPEFGFGGGPGRRPGGREKKKE